MPRLSASPTAIQVGPDSTGTCGWSAPGEAERSGARHRGRLVERKGVPPMVVMIGPTGVYLILALVFLVILGGGVIVAYRMSNRDDK